MAHHRGSLDQLTMVDEDHVVPIAIDPPGHVPMDSIESPKKSMVDQRAEQTERSTELPQRRQSGGLNTHPRRGRPGVLRLGLRTEEVDPVPGLEMAHPAVV